MQEYRKLEVWARAHALVLEADRLTANSPAGERFGLTADTPGGRVHSGEYRGRLRAPWQSGVDAIS